MFADEVGVKPNLVHIPSKIIAKYDKDIGDGLLGDKSHSMIFDNSKIKKLVLGFKAQIPFRQGVKEIVKWHQKNADYKKLDERINNIFDNLIQRGFN